MSIQPKAKLIRLRTREQQLSMADAFHEGRVLDDLSRIANAPGMLERLAERYRIRSQKAGEQAALRHWTNLYDAGARLVAARTAMERGKLDYFQLPGEYELRGAERDASLAKLQADTEEHRLRRDKASYQRQHQEQFCPSAEKEKAQPSETEQKFHEANERRKYDARWDLHESLRASTTLVELQHWRRQRRDQILRDRSLTPEEQSEALQFVDELFCQKRSELKADARIFEDD